MPVAFQFDIHRPHHIALKHDTEARPRSTIFTSRPSFITWRILPARGAAGTTHTAPSPHLSPSHPEPQEVFMKNSIPPGFSDMLSFPLIEALLGRRSRRFFAGAEIPDGVLAYTSTREPVPLTEAHNTRVFNKPSTLVVTPSATCPSTSCSPSATCCRTAWYCTTTSTAGASRASADSPTSSMSPMSGRSPLSSSGRWPSSPSSWRPAAMPGP